MSNADHNRKGKMRWNIERGSCWLPAIVLCSSFTKQRTGLELRILLAVLRGSIGFRTTHVAVVVADLSRELGANRTAVYKSINRLKQCRLLKSPSAGLLSPGDDIVATRRQSVATGRQSVAKGRQMKLLKEGSKERRGEGMKQTSRFRRLATKKNWHDTPTEQSVVVLCQRVYAVLSVGRKFPPPGPEYVSALADEMKRQRWTLLLAESVAATICRKASFWPTIPEWLSHRKETATPPPPTVHRPLSGKEAEADNCVQEFCEKASAILGVKHD